MKSLLFWLIIAAILAMGMHSDAIRNDLVLVDFNLKR